MREFSLDQSLVQELAIIINESIEKEEDMDTYIRLLADFLIDKQGLREDVGGVIIQDEKEPGSKVKGTMGKDNHNLYFYRKGLQYAYENFAEGISDLFNEDEKKGMKYLNCAKVIIHELEHLKQAIDAKAEDKDDIKTQIIKLCDRENGLVAQLGYRVMRKLHPTERYADTVAYETILSVCDILGDQYKRVANLLELIDSAEYIEGYYIEFDKGYDSKNGPTYYCMRNFTKDGQFEEFEKKLKSSELSFNDRLFLGLHLSQEEIDSIAKYRADLKDSLFSKVGKAK